MRLPGRFIRFLRGQILTDLTIVNTQLRAGALRNLRHATSVGKLQMHEGSAPQSPNLSGVAIAELYLYNRPSDDDLAAIVWPERVVAIACLRARAQGAGLTSLPHSQPLHLSLSGSAINDAGIAYLPVGEYWRLNLSYTEIEGPGLAALAPHDIAELDLRGLPIEPADLAPLAGKTCRFAAGGGAPQPMKVYVTEPPPGEPSDFSQLGLDVEVRPGRK